MESWMAENRPLIAWGWVVKDLSVKGPKEIFTFWGDRHCPYFDCGSSYTGV